mmetsp:Transcript_3454/g.9944  ORF Transcript_3454/g.9944 Transcript_3454/m.9944 type:complete len:233 (+) Transcript_3454:147-845(+)
MGRHVCIAVSRAGCIHLDARLALGELFGVGDDRELAHAVVGVAVSLLGVSAGSHCLLKLAHERVQPIQGQFWIAELPLEVGAHLAQGACHARNVDDARAFCRADEWQERLRERHGAVVIRLESWASLVLEGGGVRALEGRAGVVHQDMKRLLLRLDAFCEGSDGRGVRNVAHGRRAFASAAELGHGFLAPLLRSAGDDDPVVCFKQLLGDVEADALICAGDDGEAVGGGGHG